MIGTVRVIQRNVKNWSSGEMCLRWTAAGMLEAETRFRKVQGYRGLATLAVKIEADLLRRRQAPTQTTEEGHRSSHCVTMTLGPPPLRISTTSGTTSGAESICLLAAG